MAIDWAYRNGVDQSFPPRALNVPLSDGSTFDFDEYLRDLQAGTAWVTSEMERRLGMHTFIQAHHAVHAPHKQWKTERTLKTFVLAEAESISRDAKVAWAQRNGHACCNLQHDGVIVALQEGTDERRAAQLMRAASERALGYDQPNELKAVPLL